MSRLAAALPRILFYGIETICSGRSKPIARICIVISCLAVLTVSCGRMDVSTEMNAELGNAISQIFTLSLRRGDAQSINEPKLRVFEGDSLARSVQDPSASLKMTITGRPDDLGETYHVLAFASDPTATAGGSSNDASFVPNRIGQVFHLHMKKGDPQLESSTNGFLHLGSALLAYQQSTDRVAPWDIAPGAQHCLVLSPGECADIKTITKTLFVQLVAGVEDAVKNKVPLGVASLHQLHYFPQTKHSGIDPQRRARGFGFIYHARIDVPGGGFDVYVPISFLLVDNVQSYTLFIDPISNFGTLGAPENLDRIFVHGDGIVGIAEGLVKDSIVDAVKSQHLPQLIPGVAFEDVVMLGLNTAAGGGPHLEGQHLSSKYEAILLPDEGDPANHVFSSNVLWEKTHDGDVTEVRRVKLVFLE